MTSCEGRLLGNRFGLRVDPVILACLALLTLLGLAFVYSAGGPLDKQLLWTGLGVLLFIAVARVNYHRLIPWAAWFYAAGMLALAAVLFTRPINGARSWFRIGPVSLQPSEFMKAAVILALARILMYQENVHRVAGLLVPLAGVLAPVVLILKQPDLGTAVTFAPMAAAMLIAAGARPRHLLVLGGLGLSAAVALFFTLLNEIQKMRIYAWLDPSKYRMREAYQVINAKIAFGIGGITGNGFGEGFQTQAHRVPEAHTDFISTAIGEEWGFLGMLLVIILFIVFFLTALSVADRCRDAAGRLVVAGCIGMLGGQVFLNLGVATGLLPCTGITLPFFSYGGSSMLSSFMMAGLIGSVSAHGDRSLPGACGRLRDS